MTDYGYVDVGKLADFANNTIGGLTANDIMRFPRADVQPISTFNEELLIGAFGTLCDFLVDMQLCARDCPYSGNRNEDGECNAWQVIHDIRSKREAIKG